MAPQMFSAPGTIYSSVPLALVMFSAPSTIIVQCPWHYHYLHCTVVSILLKWVLVSHLFLGFQPASRDDLGTSLLATGVPCGLHIPPGNRVDHGYTGYSVIPLLTGQSPLALLWCVMVECTLPDVGLLATLQMSYIHCCSFPERNWFLYDFLHVSCLASQHVLADGDVDVFSVEGG